MIEMSAHDHGNCELCDHIEAERDTLNTLYRTQLDIVQEQGREIHKIKAELETFKQKGVCDCPRCSAYPALLSDRDLWRSVAMGAKEALKHIEISGQLEISWYKWKAKASAVPNYCGSIEAAFEIDAWVKREHPDWQFSVYRVKDDFACVIGTADKHYADYADTAPMAIALCFLKLQETK